MIEDMQYCKSWYTYHSKYVSTGCNIAECLFWTLLVLLHFLTIFWSAVNKSFYRAMVKSPIVYELWTLGYCHQRDLLRSSLSCSHQNKPHPVCQVVLVLFCLACFEKGFTKCLQGSLTRRWQKTRSSSWYNNYFILNESYSLGQPKMQKKSWTWPFSSFPNNHQKKTTGRDKACDMIQSDRWGRNGAQIISL